MKLWTVLFSGLLSIASAALGQETQPQTQTQSQTEDTVFVVGAVRMPGAYPLMDAATLVNALKASGWLQPDANSRAVVIIRPASEATANTKAENIRVNLREILDGKNPDFPLQAHDIVYIPSIYKRGTFTVPPLPQLFDTEPRLDPERRDRSQSSIHAGESRIASTIASAAKSSRKHSI